MNDIGSMSLLALRRGDVPFVPVASFRAWPLTSILTDAGAMVALGPGALYDGTAQKIEKR